MNTTIFAEQPSRIARSQAHLPRRHGDTPNRVWMVCGDPLNRAVPALKKYDEETQARAVRMYQDRIKEGGVSQRAARVEVGSMLGVNGQTLRNWIRRELGDGTTPAAGGEAVDAEVARLRRENAQLGRANEILKTASAFFRGNGARPQTRTVIDYVREYADRFESSRS